MDACHLIACNDARTSIGKNQSVIEACTKDKLATKFECDIFDLDEKVKLTIDRFSRSTKAILVPKAMGNLTLASLRSDRAGI